MEVVLEILLEAQYVELFLHFFKGYEALPLEAGLGLEFVCLERLAKVHEVCPHPATLLIDVVKVLEHHLE